jgi:AAA family ATP:ADP antiporter
VKRLFAKVVDVRRGELPAALLMFAYSFFAMTAYNILKPLTRSKFISQLGADNLPYVQLAAGILIGFLMHGYAHATRRLPRRLVIPITQAGLVLLLLVTWFLFRTGAAWVPVAFYVFGLILGILLISQFWTLANDVYDARQAKRLFGFIGGGASLGGAMGAGITALAVEGVGTDNLLLVSAALLVLCIGLVFAVDRFTRRGERTDPFDDQRGVGGSEALQLLRSSKHLQVVALVIACAAVGAAVIEQQLNMAAEAMKPDGATNSIAAFLATVTFYLSIAGFGVQVLLTSRIHRSAGLAVALLLLPISLGATGVVVLLSGALWSTAIARVFDSTLRYTVDKTTREILFLPIPSDLKYRAKPFLDVTVDRVAKALGALLLLVLIKPWGLGLDWRRLSYASIAVTAIWIAVALLARHHYLQSFRASIGARTIEPHAIAGETADAATIEALVEELANPDEGAVLYAIDMLESLERRNLVTPLLLYHESPRVRARALAALSTTRSGASDRWVAMVTRMLTDDDVGVRAAAIRALSGVRREDAAMLMRRCLDDVEPRIAVTAAVSLADSMDAAESDAAAATLQRLIDDGREQAAPGRREAAAALAHIRNPRFRTLLVPLLYDRDPYVSEEAVTSAGALGPSDGLFLPALVSKLGDRKLKGAARQALAAYDGEMLETLGLMLRDSREDIWVRRHLPATLAETPSQEALDVLVESLDENDGFLRYKVLEAIEQMRRQHPSLTMPRRSLEAQIVRDTTAYYSGLTLRWNLTRGIPDADRSLLGRALGDKLARTLDRIYRLLGLLHSAHDVEAARRALEGSDSGRRAAAVEYLDNLLSGTIRKRVLPILEDAPLDHKVHFAYGVLGSHPRDVEDTLAQLVHDDDPVLAAAAIHFVAERGVGTLAEDLKFVAERRADEPYIAEAAGWALANRAGQGGGQSASVPLPAVDIVQRVCTLPLFALVSIDEAFRIVNAGQQRVWPPHREIQAAGHRPEYVQLLIAGSVTVDACQGAPDVATSPVALAFEEALRRAPATSAIRAIDQACTLAFDRDAFLTMVADSTALAQGLFRMLLADSRPVAAAWTPAASDTPPAGALVAPIDRMLWLRRHAWVEGASRSQLQLLASVAREVPLQAGKPVCAPGDAPAIYQVVAGEVLLDVEAANPVHVGAGGMFGVVETLVDLTWSGSATATADGRALRVDRQDLFAALSDVGFLESLLASVLPSNAERPAGATV